MNGRAPRLSLIAGFASGAALLATSGSPAAPPESPMPAATARRDPGPPAPDQARMLRHRQLVEQGQRTSRAGRPEPPRASPPRSGIVLIPIDTNSKATFDKRDSRPAPATRAAVRTKGTGTMPIEPVPPPPACPYTPGLDPAMKTASLSKAFPEIEWHICVRDMRRKGLWVGPVHMRRDESGPWVPVLYQAGLAEIFVPYHQTGFRPYDLRWTEALSFVTSADAGPNGVPVWLTNETGPTVVAEVRERGIGWLCKGGPSGAPTSSVRRGEEFAIWGVIDGGNYDNIVEFAFRDDGGMTMRMGNTGVNDPGNPFEPHSHVALWRVDLDVNGGQADSAHWLSHSEPGRIVPLSFAQDDRAPLAVESAARWDYEQFTQLLVEDSAANAFGHRYGYVFSPVQDGASRHFGNRNSWELDWDMWTQNDVYVLRYHPNELDWAGPLNVQGTGLPVPWVSPDAYLLPPLNGEAAAGQDLVVWIKSTAHHHPTDEDRAIADLASGGHSGITLTHWNGFKIDPYNYFNFNPLGGPAFC